MANNVPVVVDDSSEVSSDASDERATLLERGQTIVVPMSRENFEAYLAQKFTNREG